MIYKVGDKKNNLICICADGNTAIFAPFKQLKNGDTITKMKDMVAYANYPV